MEDMAKQPLPDFNALMYIECPHCHAQKGKFRCFLCKDKGLVLSEFGESMKDFVSDIVYDLAEPRDDYD